MMGLGVGLGLSYGGGGGWSDGYLPTGMDPENLVLVLDYKADKYYEGGVEKARADVHTYARTGDSYAYKMVAGNLEIVTVAGGVLPLAVSPLTGGEIGADINPTITRQNIRYAPDASQLTTSGATIADLTLNALGNFPSVKVESTGSLTDRASTASADDVSLTASTAYSFQAIIQDDGESPTVRLALVGATSGNECVVEYTFATNAASNPIVTGGVFADLKGELLIDGSHRITGSFTPTATEAFGLRLLPYTTTPGDGFTLSAWFVHYWDGQQRGFPTPVLGPQGSTAISYRPTASDGLLAVSGDRTVIISYLRDIKNSHWDAMLEWRGSVGVIDIRNRNDFKNHPVIDDGTTSENATTALQWGERTTVAISYEAGVIVRFALYDRTTGLTYTPRVGTLALDDAVDFYIGVQKAGSAVVGGAYETALFFDVAMTQAQIEEAVQRGFNTESGFSNGFSAGFG